MPLDHCQQEGAGTGSCACTGCGWVRRRVLLRLIEHGAADRHADEHDHIDIGIAFWHTLDGTAFPAPAPRTRGSIDRRARDPRCDERASRESPLSHLPPRSPPLVLIHHTTALRRTWQYMAMIAMDNHTLMCFADRIVGDLPGPCSREAFSASQRTDVAPSAMCMRPNGPSMSVAHPRFTSSASSSQAPRLPPNNRMRRHKDYSGDSTTIRAAHIFMLVRAL